ncbi:NUDIX hydrolase [Ktedonobacteria bacterium brp13]|nr:NUDIX hydrolase [Ktedonobacteria bacterium brp13]
MVDIKESIPAHTPSFVIGVGGHQYLGDEKTQQFVMQQFRTLLASYQQRESHLILYSALALGTDQLFVHIALELGVRVEIVLPCAEYESIFSSEAEKQEYNRLLHAAQTIHQLPAQQCSDDAFLAAEQWIVDKSNLVILAWNGLPSQGRSGTGDIASYARFVGCPFIHINTKSLLVKTYGEKTACTRFLHTTSPKQEFTVAKQQVYSGSTLVVNQYHVRMPDGNEVVRDVMERPEGILILPVGMPDIVLLIEEYDFGAGVWQLTLPGGKVELPLLMQIEEQANKELRQEIGYKAGRLDKLTDFYSHPGYISHHVHVFIAHDLEWDPLEMEVHEEIKVHTYTIKDALEATMMENRCDPEASLALWLYAQKKYSLTKQIEMRRE